MEQRYENQCQSCGMPLKKGEESGTELDGSKSLMYCHYCYKNGKFTDPDATVESMKKINDEVLKKKGWIKPLRLLSLWQLPTLKRWKTKS